MQALLVSSWLQPRRLYCVPLAVSILRYLRLKKQESRQAHFSRSVLLLLSFFSFPLLSLFYFFLFTFVSTLSLLLLFPSGPLSLTSVTLHSSFFHSIPEPVPVSFFNIFLSPIVCASLKPGMVDTPLSFLCPGHFFLLFSFFFCSSFSCTQESTSWMWKTSKIRFLHPRTSWVGWQTEPSQSADTSRCLNLLLPKIRGTVKLKPLNMAVCLWWNHCLKTVSYKSCKLIQFGRVGYYFLDTLKCLSEHRMLCRSWWF